MTNTIFSTINVKEIQEIKPHVERNSPFTLDIKVHMDTHQLAELLLNILEDFGEELLNEALEQHDLKITYTGT
jgi:hypothetical protein